MAKRKPRRRIRQSIKHVEADEIVAANDRVFEQSRPPLLFRILVDIPAGIARAAGVILALSFTVPADVMTEMPRFYRFLQHLDPALSAWFSIELLVRAVTSNSWRSYMFSARGVFNVLAALPPTSFVPVEAIRHLGRFLMATSTQFMVDAIQIVIDAAKRVVTENENSLKHMIRLVLVSMLAGCIVISIVEDSESDSWLWVINQILPFLGLPTEFKPTTISGRFVEVILTLVRYTALTWIGAMVLKTWGVVGGSRSE